MLEGVGTVGRVVHWGRMGLKPQNHRRLEPCAAASSSLPVLPMWPVCTSHRLIVLSPLPLPRVLPSGLKLTPDGLQIRATEPVN